MANCGRGSGHTDGLFASCTLYLANLPFDATAGDVARVFEPLTSRLVDCQINQNGSGMIICQRPGLAERAYNAELTLFGRPIIVRLQPEQHSVGYSSGRNRQNRNQRRRNQQHGSARQQQQFSGRNGSYSNYSTKSSSTADVDRLCADTKRVLRLSTTNSNINSDATSEISSNNVSSRRRTLEQAIRERDIDKLKLATADWPGGHIALAEFCSGSGVGSFSAARSGGALPIIHDLVSEASRPIQLLECLIECCRQGLDDVQASAAVGRLLNSRDQYGFTPLHRAVRAGADSAVEFLLANSADVAAVTERDKRTSLHIHLWLGCGILAYRLLDFGTDPDACDADNWTALHWCAKNGYLEFARHLICERNVRLFRSQGSTLNPLKLCLQQINQCANGGPNTRLHQQQQQQENLLSSLFAIANLLLRHGSDLPSQAFLSDWLAATSSVSWEPTSDAINYDQLVDLLALEGAVFSTDNYPVPICPRPLLHLCRLNLRARLRLLSDCRSIVCRLLQLPLPPLLLSFIDLRVDE